LLCSSGVCYYFFQAVNDNVVIVLKRNSHPVIWP
jgi:hypothetical protein